MKKRTLITTLIAVIVLSAFSSTVFAQESEKSMTIPKVKDGAITVDAQKDEIYDNCEPQVIGEHNLGTFPDSPQNTSGEFYMVYDSEYIYLYVNVIDKGAVDYSNPYKEEIWNRDSIGVILDFSFNREFEYEYSYEKNGDKVCYVELSGDDYLVTNHMYAEDADTNLYEKIMRATMKHAVVMGVGNVAYEIAMPIPEGIELNSKTKVGFEISIQDAFEGTGVGVTSWSPNGALMYKWSDVCGRLMFEENVVNMQNTEDGVISNESIVDSMQPVIISVVIVGTIVCVMIIGAVVLLKKRKAGKK